MGLGEDMQGYFAHNKGFANCILYRFAYQHGLMEIQQRKRVYGMTAFPH